MKWMKLNTEMPAVRGEGFSLVELLVVIAIIALLMVLATPALSSMMQGTDVSRAGSTVVDQVNLARQAASAKSQVMELRFIKLRDRTAPGYDALQVWSSDAAGNLKPERPLAALPQSVVIATNTLSPVFQNLTNGLTMPQGVGAVSGQPYAAVQIRPTGQVTPPIAMSNLFFAVVPAGLAANSQLPPNYVLVQLNPLNAAPLIYRP